ncbi:asparaginase [Psychromarinibacter sp. S121]|uniref:asparaginase n=1 Tax=Psychromarinibacter sp. S121 TaxID=3415127 RepID=UPI003C7BB7EF
MKEAEALVEVWRGELLESSHLGHAVVCDSTGAIVEAWGDPDRIIYPRSSAKMIQGLPLVESGAADAAGLTTEHLALACASHQGAPEHTERVERWLSDLGMTDADLRCGEEFPRDEETGHAMIRAHGQPCQWHNNCSGKHSGFLTLNRHLGGGTEYVEIDHPVQKAAREAFEEVTGMDSPCYGIDGCAAPNFATSVHGLARAMARFAAAGQGGGGRDAAAARLRDAMMAHPSLVAGEGRACTELMRALDGRGALKTGAEGVFVGILPELGMGLALKIADGATRASECALAAILVRLGVLDRNHPATIKRMNPPIPNRRGMTTGEIRPAPALV